MSIRHIAAVADLTGLCAARKSILFSLAIDADRDGLVVLDRTRLREHAGMSERSLRTHLKALIADGWLNCNDPDMVAEPVISLILRGHR